MASGRRVAARTFDATILGLRLAWPVLALFHFSGFGLESTVYATELLLLVVLVGETHPTVTRGLDPGPPDDESFFARDTGATALFVLTFLGYLAILLRLWEVHIPHVLADSLHTAVPGDDLSLLLSALGFTAVSGLAIGGYAHLREPGVDGVLYRVFGTLHDFTAEDVHRRRLQQLESVLAGERSYELTVVVVSFVALGVGMAVSVLAFGLAGLAAQTLRYPRFFLVIVLGWLAYDAYAHRLGDPGGIGALLVRVGHEAEAPKAWLFGLNVLQSGMKGVFVTVYLISGGVFTVIVLAGSGVGTLVTFGGLLVELGFSVAESIARWGPIVVVASPRLLPTVVGLVGLTIGAVGAVFSVGVYGMVYWYQLLQRLPAWIPDYWEGPLEPVETRPLPRYATGNFLALTLSFYALVALFGHAEPILSAADARTYIPALWAFAASHLLLARYGVEAVGDAFETLRRGTTELSRRSVRRDNHRILLYLLVVFGGSILLLGDYPLWPAVGLLLGMAMAHYIPEVERAVGQHIDSPFNASLTTHAYLVVSVAVAFLSVAVMKPSLAPIRWMIPVAAGLFIIADVADLALLGE